LNSPVSGAAVIYLHGFLSSSSAFKAAQCAQFLQASGVEKDGVQCLNTEFEFFVPDIPDKPSEAIPFLIAYIRNLAPRPIYLLGSSLGGFYAHFLSDYFSCPAVLINPVVDVCQRMQYYSVERVGKLSNPYRQNCFSIEQSDRQALEKITASMNNKPEHYFVLLQMADEVLDARLAAKYYQHSCCLIEAGGNHQYQGFERHLPTIFHWFGLLKHKPKA